MKVDIPSGYEIEAVSLLTVLDYSSRYLRGSLDLLTPGSGQPASDG